MADKRRGMVPDSVIEFGSDLLRRGKLEKFGKYIVNQDALKAFPHSEILAILSRKRAKGDSDEELAAFWEQAAYGHDDPVFVMKVMLLAVAIGIFLFWLFLY